MVPVHYSKIFYGALIVALVHSYGLLRSTDENSRNVASAFTIISVHHSYTSRPTTTALHQMQMSQPYPGSDVVVDHERAQYCIDHLGTCTLAEMESLKNGRFLFGIVKFLLTHQLMVVSSISLGFHTERMQSFISGYENDSSVLESRLLEGELDLQMALLKEQNAITDVLVFPVDEIEDAVLPHLHDTDTKGSDDHSIQNHRSDIFHQPTPTDIFVFEETIMEENLLEPIAICCAIIGLALLPQLV